MPVSSGTADLNGRHLAVLHAGDADAETISLQVETNQSHVLVALCAPRLLRDGRTARPTGGWSPSPGSSPTS